MSLLALTFYQSLSVNFSHLCALHANIGKYEKY